MERLRPALSAIVLSISACLLSSGCDGGDAGNSDGGLLLNPTFARGADGEIVSWAFVQHTGQPSYRFDTDGRTLLIERVGRERWGQAIQTLPADGLAGRTLEFSAEIAGQLDDHSGPPSSPTGVGVRISGMRPGMPAALGVAILSSLPGQPEIGVGRHDWTEQRVVFEVPESATEIQLSLRLTLDGTLRVRNPRLVQLAP